ncbi:aminotransferase class V-fold PLP-dependent enzyme, partial [Candidatus Saccharibacteria bacterium]|nr:aminotransferase class V-fold PLP-dependent enzyme [Candidatus Saccharibacteria bacterium]
MINLDNAAGTRVLPGSWEAMEPYMTGDKYLNPSAPYLQAEEVRRDYEGAKDRLARAVGARGENLIITSGATEANNLAFTAISYLTDGEVLISPFEHPSIRNIPVKNKKIINVSKRKGVVDLKDLGSRITAKTVLISVSLVASDIGTIQPISEIAQIVRKERQRRLMDDNKTPIWLHVDASQGFSVYEVNVGRLRADMLTLNSGKMHGPKG